MACTPHLPHGATLRRPSMLSSLRLARQLITWPQSTAISFIPSHQIFGWNGIHFVPKKNLGWIFSFKKREKNLGWNRSTALLSESQAAAGPTRKRPRHEPGPREHPLLHRRSSTLDTSSGCASSRRPGSVKGRRSKGKSVIPARRSFSSLLHINSTISAVAT